MPNKPPNLKTSKPRRARDDDHPVLRAIVLIVCVAACVGALLWRGMGW